MKSPTLLKDNRQTPLPNQDPTGGLQDGSLKITAQLKKSLLHEEYEMLVTISSKIVKSGLKLKDAVLLSNYNMEDVKDLIEREPLVLRLFEMKEIEKKAVWLKTMHNKAATDSGAAQWLLEAEFNEEYGKKKAHGTSTGRDPVQEALQFIQSTGDNDPLVKKSSSMPYQTEKSGVKTLTKKLKDFLV